METFVGSVLVVRYLSPCRETLVNDNLGKVYDDYPEGLGVGRKNFVTESRQEYLNYLYGYSTTFNRGQIFMEVEKLWANEICKSSLYPSDTFC